MEPLSIYLIIINALGFLLMRIDKQKAKKKRWRIPDAAVGGSLGSLMGMYAFRHKTRHTKFTVGVPLLMTVHIILLLLWLWR